jgi:hypothetical protein
MLKNCRSYTSEMNTMRGKVLEILQDKKLPYAQNADEFPDIPEAIVTWMIWQDLLLLLLLLLRIILRMKLFNNC